jgi:hypothetical protein
LWLDNNRLTSLGDGIFKDLVALSELRLVGNLLTAVTSNLFNAQATLQHLALGYNQITFIEEYSFLKLTNLQSLDISYNKLASINNKHFKNLSELVDLFLISSEILHIESYSFSELDMLTLLDLSDNGITEIGLNAFPNNGLQIKLTLNENLNCCSRVLYQDYPFYTSQRCTQEGNIYLLSDFSIDKCNFEPENSVKEKVGIPPSGFNEMTTERDSPIMASKGSKIITFIYLILKIFLHL